MRTLTVYRHGLTGGTPPGKNNHKRALRGTTEGWSKSSTRNNTRFLYSVDETGLTGHGFALSLTLRTCPPTHKDWATVRTSFERRMRRMGMIRMHWLTEWQRRGVPHMHAAIWFDADLRERDPYAILTIRNHWLAVADQYGAGEKGQDIKPISDAMGWFKYLAKHAVRGLNHYQRNKENVPAAWSKTGRMWGYLGDWPVSPVDRFSIDDSGYYKFRRAVRGYARATTRAEFHRDPKMLSRMIWARNMLKVHDKNLSNVIGVNDWADKETISIPLLRWLSNEGHNVESTGD